MSRETFEYSKLNADRMTTDRLLEELNARGAEGWRLVGFCGLHNATVLFERVHRDPFADIVQEQLAPVEVETSTAESSVPDIPAVPPVPPRRRR